jgi:AraC family transcriptional regulator
MTFFSPQPSPQVLFSSAGRAWNALHAAFIQIPRGVSHVPGGERHVLGMHFGPPVNADCCCDGVRLRHVQKPGDMSFVPAGVDGSWEDDARCQILRLSLEPSFVKQIAEELEGDAPKIALLSRLTFRDARTEAIGWAIKAELEADTPSDPLYIDHLTSALAVRLIETATHRPLTEANHSPKMSARHLQALTDFIEMNLGQPLRLIDLATVAGVSVTRLKILFRNSTGVSVHQYVIRRRTEYARALMATTAMPASEVALAAGFAHQSHMATTMRRIFGQAPGEIIRPTRKS